VVPTLSAPNPKVRQCVAACPITLVPHLLVDPSALPIPNVPMIELAWPEDVPILVLVLVVRMRFVERISIEHIARVTLVT